MKSISYWAKAHITEARLLVTILHLILSFMAIYGGIWCYTQGCKADLVLPQILAVLTGVAWLLYPLRGVKKGILKWTFLRQKVTDVVIVLTGLMLLTCTGNWLAQVTELPDQADIQVRRVALRKMPAEEPVTEKLFKKKKKHPLKKIWKLTKSTVRDHVRTLRAAELETKQVVFLILSILAALVLLYFVVVLSCGIWCNGYEFLAGMVFFGGIGLVLFLYAVALRAIFKNTDNQKRKVLIGLLALIAIIIAILILIRIFNI